jgi:hypothetical protein
MGKLHALVSVLLAAAAFAAGCFQPSSSSSEPTTVLEDASTNQATSPDVETEPRRLSWIVEDISDNQSSWPFELVYDGKGRMYDQWGRLTTVHNYSFTIPDQDSDGRFADEHYTYHIDSKTGWYIAFSSRDLKYTLYGDALRYPGLPSYWATPFLFIATMNAAVAAGGGGDASGGIGYELLPASVDVPSVNDCRWFGVHPRESPSVTEYYVCMTQDASVPLLSMRQTEDDGEIYRWNGTGSPPTAGVGDPAPANPDPPTLPWAVAMPDTPLAIAVPPINLSGDANILREMAEAVGRDPRFPGFALTHEALYAQSAAWLQRDAVAGLTSQGFQDLPFARATIKAAAQTEAFDGQLTRAALTEGESAFVSEHVSGSVLGSYQRFGTLADGLVPLEWVEDHLDRQGIRLDLEGDAPSPTRHWSVGDVPSVPGFSAAEPAWGLAEPCLGWDESGAPKFIPGRQYAWVSAVDGHLIILGESLESRFGPLPGCMWTVPPPTLGVSPAPLPPPTGFVVAQ